MFMYREQSGFIKLKGRQSRAFDITNGMREGAAASPVLWAVYADGIIKELRISKLGCYVAGCWVGAVMYADDLALISIVYLCSYFRGVLFLLCICELVYLYSIYSVHLYL